MKTDPVESSHTEREQRPLVVAAVVAAALPAPSAANRPFDVVARETPVDQALASL